MLQFTSSDAYRKSQPRGIKTYSVNTTRGQPHRGEGSNLMHKHFNIDKGPGSFDLPQDPNLHPIYYQDTDIGSIPLNHQNTHYTWHNVHAPNPHFVNKVGSSMTLHQ